MEKRPYILIDARQVLEPAAAAEAILQFVQEHGIQVLNVAGPLASGWEEGHTYSMRVVGEVIGVLGN